MLGDGEEVIGEINDVLVPWHAGRRGPADRQAVLRALASVDGVYVPSLYEASFADGRLTGVRPRQAGVPEVVHKRTIADLGEWPYPRTSWSRSPRWSTTA